MFECSKTYKFEYAHQLFTSYTSLCHETIHGHSGKVRITFGSNMDLNKDNMVIDFGYIGALIKDKLMKKYDHALFIPKDFPKEYIDVLKKYNKRLVVTKKNPTAEQFAYDIYNEVIDILNTSTDYDIMPIDVSKVEFWETESGCAIYQPDQQD